MGGSKKTPKAVAVSDQDLERIAARFKLLADPTRLRILHTEEQGWVLLRLPIAARKFFLTEMGAREIRCFLAVFI